MQINCSEKRRTVCAQFLHQYRVLMLSITVLFLASCATQLAPRYDAALFSGVTELNVSLMALFATVADGTVNDQPCNSRASQYNQLIGRVDALALQSRARPMPSGKVLEKLNEYMDERGFGSIVGDEPPSAAALDRISEDLTKMKDQDCTDGGLTALPVAAFRNGVIISLDQIITYESALNR